MLSSKIPYYLACKMLFRWNSSKKKKTLHTLAKLTMILTSMCVFLPILILCITNGFQVFSIKKLENFYAPYSVRLTEPLLKNEITASSGVEKYYQEFILLQSKKQESSSLMRAININELTLGLQQKKYEIKQGKLPKKNEIIIGEGLAMSTGLNIGDAVKVHLFLPYSSIESRTATLTIAGIISFKSASLDRMVSFTLPETLESSFFLNSQLMNTISSNTKANLEKLQLSEHIAHLEDMPYIQQMKLQYRLLQILVLASSFLCFFSLYMNLKTTVSYNNYTLNVLHVLGIDYKAAIQIFFIQNIIITFIGIIVGLLLCWIIVPHISHIIQFVETAINWVLLQIQTSTPLLKEVTPIEFLPKDIFYIQSVPVEFQIEDLLLVLSIIISGVFIINNIYLRVMKNTPIMETLKIEQGV